MKKIYNYLFPVFLSLFALAACDEDNEEIVPMSYTDPVATVTKIDPVEGYISGTGDVVVDILVEEPTDVVIGFVCTITVKQGRAKIDNFKLELVEQ